EVSPVVDVGKTRGCDLGAGRERAQGCHLLGIEGRVNRQKFIVLIFAHELTPYRDEQRCHITMIIVVCYRFSRGESGMKKRKSASRQLGRSIVADPEICHGKPTFRGTRIFVADVLEQVASGMTWEAIIEEWDGGITEETIAEAVQLAAQALLKHADEFVIESTPA